MHERGPLGGFDLGQQPVADVKEHRRREQHRAAFDRLALSRRHLKQQLDQYPGEETRRDRQPGSPRDVAAPVRRTRLGEKGHQCRDDEDGFEALPHQQEERRHEQAHRRRAVGDDTLGALESGQQPLANGMALRVIGARHARAQPRERRLQLAGKPGVLRAHLRLDLFEREIGVEPDLLGP